MKLIIKLWKILNRSQRKKSFYLFFLTILSMFLEIIGVGLVIPAINLLIKSDIITEYPQLNPIMNYFNNPTHLQLIVIGMIVIVIVYLIKNLFISYFLWYQNNYSYGIQLSLAKKLYENYLYQPYAFHLRRNSAVLMRNI